MTSNAICHNRNETQWEVNAVGQDPCAQYAVLMASCDTNFMVPPMTNTSQPYLPTVRISACACNVVAYNLASACTWCQSPSQSRHWVTQDEWQGNCTSLEQLYWIAGLPHTSRPPSISIPEWAFHPPAGEGWDPAEAAANATGPDLPNGTINGSSHTEPSSSTGTVPSASLAPSPPPTFQSGRLPPFAIGLISVLLIIAFLIGLLIGAKKVSDYIESRGHKPADTEMAFKHAPTHALRPISTTSSFHNMIASPQTGLASLASSPTTHYPVASITAFASDENAPEPSNRGSSLSTRVAYDIPSVAVRYAWAKLVTSTGITLEILQNQPLRDLLLACNPKAALIDHSMLVRDIETIFECAKGSIKQIFQEYQGRFHISCDGSHNKSEYVGINAQWIYKGHLTHIILDFVSFEKGDDESASQRLISILEEFGIDKRIDGVICDHDMVNGTILNTAHLAGSRGKDVKPRCVGQRINLVVKEIMSRICASTNPGHVGMPKQPEQTNDHSDLESLPGIQEKAGEDPDKTLVKNEETLDQVMDKEAEVASEEKLPSLASVEPIVHTISEIPSTKLEKFSLSDELTRKSAILGSWFRPHGLIPDNDIMDVLK